MNASNFTLHHAEMKSTVVLIALGAVGSVDAAACTDALVAGAVTCVYDNPVTGPDCAASYDLLHDCLDRYDVDNSFGGCEPTADQMHDACTVVTAFTTATTAVCTPTSCTREPTILNYTTCSTITPLHLPECGVRRCLGRYPGIPGRRRGLRCVQVPLNQPKIQDIQSL